MRRLQLKVVSGTYLITNVLILSEMAYLFLFMKEKYEACGGMCAQPYDQKAAAILLLLGLCHILPVELNIVSFYFIPRRFQV